MSSLCSSGLYSLGHQSGCSMLPLPSLPTDLSNTTTRKDPSLKQQACQLYLEEMGMRAPGRVLGIHHKTVSRWLVQAAQALPASPPQTEVCSFIEIDELCTFIAKKVSMLALASGRLHLWQGPRLCLWKKDDQNG